MPQISKKFQDRETEERILELLTASFLSCKNRNETSLYIKDLLTPTQRITIAKRLSIALMILEGYPYQTIRETLKVSTSTIGDVARILNIQGEGFRKIFFRFKKSRNKAKLWRGLLKITGEYLIWATNPDKRIAKYKINKARQRSKLLP